MGPQVGIALTLDLSNTDGTKDGHTRALSLQHSDDKLLGIPPRLIVALAIVRSLQEFNQLLYSQGLCAGTNFQRHADELAYHRIQLEGQLKSVAMLETKVQRVLNLVRLSSSRWKTCG